MRITHALVLMVCGSLSCGPHHSDPDPTYRVGAWDLVDHVRDQGDKAYRGKRIQVRVPPRSYTTDGDTVSYFSGVPHTRPVIVFECIDPQPAGNDCALTIHGTFTVAVQDGHRKADRVTFTIRVDQCMVTRIVD